MTIASLTRRVRRIGSGVLVAVATACGGGDAPPAPESVAGTYTLQTVDNDPLPYTLLELQEPEGLYRLELVSGRYTLSADGTFAVTHRYRESRDGVVFDEGSENSSGTFTRGGNVITLRDAEGTTTATWSSSGTLTIVGEGQEGPVTMRYSR